MSEAGQSAVSVTNVRRLSDAMREMKNAAADRADVVVEMREASRTRLELLAQELQPVFDDVPADDPTFDFAISSGEQPRLWIDAVAHVAMGRDRRTYRFVRDTRLGRVVLAESAEIAPVANQVTRYIAERLVERQRAVEGDVEPLPRGDTQEQETVAPTPYRSAWSSFFSGVAFVILGGIVGVATVVVAMWDRFPELDALLSRF
ncbi:hypothetical protein JF546_06330 [Nitratireductor aquimarinus]|uniref:Type IV / VI secretion system DotU domain-containing protein n=1 Tax=Nitratireductor aquimarinus TaxID=889300 RepID=A0ABU4AG55_9HYPH|nr:MULTISPECIES: hypothetical protein [Alphaproteobacteria]MBY6022433.1 hypothetical protein [Nitratireductor sp. DP7N14-4]MBN7757642.1 hypothetical protein [Nitratireductor aquimarinus]MBN7763773.1 hypothetical protein [Nitratireductor aquibiodomus]MBN7775033.1 hypothetical protein [Nitratireductor pacificus]MBN7779894.1 hypothetical protein [Nitratireductor pacificus]